MNDRQWDDWIRGQPGTFWGEEKIRLTEGSGGGGGGSGGGGNGSGGEGCGVALAALVGGAFLLYAVYTVVSGYVLSAKVLWHYWASVSYRSIDWGPPVTFAVAALVAVPLASYFWGWGVGMVVGLIPAIPLIYASTGEVGFWYIVDGTSESPSYNTFSSRVALAGMLAIHCTAAWLGRRRERDAGETILNHSWIKTHQGRRASIGLAVACFLALTLVGRAIQQF